MSEIKFEYSDIRECNIPKMKECCCICDHRMIVYNHCCHTERELPDKCVCNTKAGFFVCKVWHETDKSHIAQICGEHGMCEMFTKKEGIK